MKIAYLTSTLNPHTGAGVFSNHMIDGVRIALPQSSFTIMTSEDVLVADKLGLLLRMPKIVGLLAKVDVIHALDGFPYGVIAAIANFFLGKPLIITAIGTGAIQKLSHKFYGPLLRWAYRQATIITVPSSFIAKELSKALPGKDVKIINHGVDLNRWKKVSLEVPRGIVEPYILSVGAIKRRKGYHISLRVFARVWRKHSNLSYVIVGKTTQSPEYFSQLQAIMKEEGITNQVHFVSGLSENELGGLYKHAKVFLLLPQNIEGDVEGFGLVFLEAALSLLPVVSSRGTSAEDAVRDNESGVLVQPEDVVAAATTVERFVSDESFRSKFAEASRKFADNMSWQNQIEKYVQIYSHYKSNIS